MSRGKYGLLIGTGQMKASLTIFVALFLVLTVDTLYADMWMSIEKTEFFSPKGQHMLKIAPHKDWPSKPGHCRATLFRIDKEERKEVWSRYLINNRAPVSVFVADSGKYVITMDEWGQVGDFPVVIYGYRGEIIKIHSIGSLGLEYNKHIKWTTSSYWWNEDSVSFFGPDEEFFFIRLHWGKLIILHLSSGDLMNKELYNVFKPRKKWEDIPKFVEAKLKEHALRLLDSEDAGERVTGALICGQKKIAEAIPRLKQLLTDTNYYTTGAPKKWTRVYYVRKAAKEALEALGERQEGI